MIHNQLRWSDPNRQPPTASMDASFCVKALLRAIALYGPPEVMNTDQGSQFTGDDSKWVQGRD